MTDSGRTDLDDRFVALMESVWRQTRSRTPSEWSGLDLTMAQAKTLFLLGRGQRRMSEISAHLGRGMPSASGMVDRLVKKGLVERVEDASDRRVVTCMLTPAGRDAVERFWRIGRQRMESIAAGLTREELEVVVPAMEVLSKAMARDAEADNAGMGVSEETAVGVGS